MKPPNIVEFPTFCNICKKVIFTSVLCRNVNNHKIVILCYTCFNANDKTYSKIEDEILCQGEDISIDC